MASFTLPATASSPFVRKSPNLNAGSKRSPIKLVKCIQSSNPNNNADNISRFSVKSSGGNSSPASTLTDSIPGTSDLPRSKLDHLISEFQSISGPINKVKRLLDYATLLHHFPDSEKVQTNRVMGCTAQVWLTARMDEDGRVRFSADSDSEITKGFCSCLVSILDGALPEEVLEMKTEDLGALTVGLPGRASSRVNTWHNVLVSMQKKTKELVAVREGRQPMEPFPSLTITSDGVDVKGSYAAAQARYLYPDESKVKELVDVLKEKKIGVVGHFYMDPEVQGVLNAAKREWPHINLSDSLLMADIAVKMAEAGCNYITVLGVDFMSENARAMLDQAGFENVGVYRMSNERIGCSLADAAASSSYMDFVEKAAISSPALHIMYINSSLQTKAYAHELMPTMTCTSSNVLQVILQAFAQVPELTLWYGPDSYIGANIAALLRQIANMRDEEIAEIHPKHDRNSIRSLLPRLHYYQDGACTVHDIFGHEVVKKIREVYSDAFLTAHLEVPGEMFSLATEAQRRGMGVVGSTQNILDFIKQRVQEAVDRNLDDHLRFILGTESGMVTSIVTAVRKILQSGSFSGTPKINVEIVFPVSTDSMSKTSTHSSHNLNSIEGSDLSELTVVPGVAAGEGCSIHGGCASCPYMKMNTLSSLLRICQNLPDKDNTLSACEAGRFNATTPLGKSVAELGCEPILYMKQFQKTGKLPEKLIDQILHRSKMRD